MTLPAGSRLGPYEILSPLGAGGMGEVYRARDARLKREVAIKVLPERVAADPDRLARFEREAQAVAALSHPNILSIFDFGKEGSVAYAVTELLDGETLRDRIEEGPLEVRKAVEYAVQIAKGLAAAHEKGIVHRDLKPENVFMTRDGGVKILDFGLAKETSTGSGTGDSSLPTEAAARALTEPGTILGTVQYMAPEQIRGLPVDHRADLFAFGAVLYEMLSGRRAFRRATPADTASAILSQEPPEMSGPGRAVSPALERLVRRCLEKRPDQRFQSARDVAFGLEVFSPTSGLGSEAPGEHVPKAPASRLRERLAWTIAGVLLTALLALILVPALRRRGDAAPSARLRFTISPPTGVSIQGMLALSPDGRRLAFVGTTADGRDLIWIRDLDGLEARALGGTDGAAYPFWSPDSRSLAFFARGKLMRIDASGGSVQVLCDATSPRGGSWGSRGTILFSVNTGGEVHRVPENGGEPTVLPALVSRGRGSYRWPTFLPDGRHFLYFALGGNPNSIGIFAGSLDSSETTRLVSSDGEALYADPGVLVYRSGSRLMARPFDPNRLAFSGEAFSVLDGVGTDVVATGATAFSASRTGLLACQTGGAFLSRLLWYDRSGRELGAVGPDGAYWEPTLSPDGRWLAVPRFDPEKFQGTIWMIDLGRESLARLSSKATVAATPLWSPDGSRIVYTSFASPEVFVQGARGAGPETVLFRQPGFMPLDDWSRDGRLLFYEAYDFRRFHFDVWVRDLQTGTSRPLLQAAFNQLGARLSPDGRWLAYESDESGTPEIFVRSFPEAGERRQVSKGGGEQPRWRGDGKELFYVSLDRKLMSIEIRPGASLEAAPPRALFQTRIMPLIEARNHYDVTRDGQRFVVNSRRPEDASLPITVLSGWMPEKAD
ncbi:MAG: protein kinase domain-containing protein [Acidobacteriota bacterium]